MSQKNSYHFDGKTFETKEAAQEYLNSKNAARPTEKLFFLFVGSFALIFVAATIAATNSPYGRVNFSHIAWVSLKYSILVCITLKALSFAKRLLGSIKHRPLGDGEAKRKLYEVALSEIESGTMDKATLAQAIERAKGQPEKINSLYISLRVKNLLKAR